MESEEIYIDEEYGQNTLQNLYEMFKEQTLCDFRVIVEEETFHIHRIVFASASDYFKAVFSHNMLESQQEFITLNGLTKKGVKPLINFAYLGHLSLSLSTIQDVIHAATFLQMTPAINLCIKYLKKKLTFENAEEFLSIAHILSIDSLKEYYRNYILKNFLQFAKTESFQHLDATKLAAFLADDRLQTPKELSLLEIALHWYEKQTEEVQNNCFEVFNNIRYCVDGIETISYACEQEPFKSSLDPRYQQLIDFCLAYINSDAQRYLSDRKNCQVRMEEKTLVQYGGVRVVNYELDFDLHSLEDLEDRCGVRANKFYHPDIEEWFPCGALYKFSDLMSHSTFTEVKSGGVIIGGFKYHVNLETASRQAIKTVSVFTPNNLNIYDLEPLQHERAQHASVYVPGSDNSNGCIYAIGGKDNKQGLTSVEKHTCDTGKWSYTKSLPLPLLDHKAVVYNGKIYVTGGQTTKNCENPVQKFIWCYCPQKNKWNKYGSMLSEKAGHCAAIIQSKMYLCGGYKKVGFLTPCMNSICDTLEMYDFQTRNWTQLSNMLVGVYDAASLVLDDKLIIAGGETKEGDLEMLIQEYDPRLDTWTHYGQLPRQLKGLGLLACKIKYIKPNEGESHNAIRKEMYDLIDISKYQGVIILDSDGESDSSDFFPF